MDLPPVDRRPSALKKAAAATVSYDITDIILKI